MNCDQFRACLEKTMSVKTQSDVDENVRKKNKRYHRKKNKKSKASNMIPCRNQNCGKNCILFSDKRSMVSCTEKGKTYTLNQNNLNFQVSCFHIDGGVIDSLKCNKCDFAFFIKDEFNRAIFIELKGGDIRHALEQLNETLSLDTFRDITDTCKKIYGRVVVTSCVPNIQADSSVLNLKKKFAQLKGNLKIRELKFVESYNDLDQI